MTTTETTQNERHEDEATPLLTRKKRIRTPLPKDQIYILLILQVCEPLTSQSIYPYINQLISELDIVGGDERRVGFYSGLIESLFFAAEAITVLQWSRASDYMGRKPILCIGTAATIVSMLSFGFSRTFWSLVVSRCLTGIFNGNIGVMKSTMGDLTDSSNRAEGFALMPVVWAIGATIGPLIGGTFARPHERFPSVFRASFWKEFPYVLPCIVTSAYVFVALLITLAFMKESAPKKKREKTRLDSENSIVSEYDSCRDDPLPLRQLLTFPVVISVSNYVSLAFLNIAFNALFPLFCSMPIEYGGLDMTPASIGYIMGTYGVMNGVFQGLFFAKFIHRYGERQVFLNGMLSFIPLFALFPIMNLTARQTGMSPMMWVLIVLMLLLEVAMDMSYGAILMYIMASAPNKQSLGATNGLSQTTVSIARAIGPAMASSLFSLSVEKNILQGYGVYLLFVFLSVASLGIAVRLPRKVWDDPDN